MVMMEEAADPLVAALEVISEAAHPHVVAHPVVVHLHIEEDPLEEVQEAVVAVHHVDTHQDIEVAHQILEEEIRFVMIHFNMACLYILSLM